MTNRFQYLQKKSFFQFIIFLFQFPHEISPGRLLFVRHSTTVLFFQIALSQDKELSAMYGSIKTKSKEYDS